MILDNIENFDLYGFNLDVKSIQYVEGKTLLDSNYELYSIGFENETKQSDELKYEAHRNFIDLHIVLEGEEYVCINDVQNMASIQPYEKENDYELFEGEFKHKVILKKGNFLILYPDDAHKTGIIVSKSGSVKKIVVKIKFN